MAIFLTLKCNKCGFTIKPVWGVEFIKKNSGERISLPHPCAEYKAAAIILGEEADDPSLFELDETHDFGSRDIVKSSEAHNLILSRWGGWSPMICLECSNHFYLDKEKDSLACDQCNSIEVKEVEKDMGCTKCKTGRMAQDGRRWQT